MTATTSTSDEKFMIARESAGSLWTTLRWLIPLGLMIATIASLVIDLPIATMARNLNPPRWFAELLEISEAFGHGIGATLVVIGVLVLDVPRRRYWPSLIAGSVGSGLVANVFKLFVIRTRPRSLEAFPESVWSTFQGMWSLSAGNAQQSFPSAHTATAVGLAVMLTAYYPRGRWYFASLAVLVGLQRVQVAAHFPSDVFAGAIVGWMTASLCLIMKDWRQPTTAA